VSVIVAVLAAMVVDLAVAVAVAVAVATVVVVVEAVDQEKVVMTALVVKFLTSEATWAKVLPPTENYWA
jgi:hypothetical protein